MTTTASAETHSAPRTTHLLYLHGFRSSPQSNKAQRVARLVARNHPALTWWCPQLPASPAAAAAAIRQGTAQWPSATMAVIGSSLGGFYARWLSLQTGCRAVLLNPAAHPARDLARHIGAQTGWHDPGQRFFFKPAYVDELRVLEDDMTRHRGQAADPKRLFSIIARGDELLDWRDMLAFCATGQTLLLPGGEHALSDFDDHIDAVFRFLGL